MKAQLEASLRTALDFATLGTSEAGASRPSVARETPQRVFLFAKVSPPCSHSPVTTGPCDAAGAATVEEHRWAAGGSVVGTRRRSRARRGGTVKVVPQPCTWAHEPRT